MSGKRALVSSLVIVVAIVVVRSIMIIGSPSEERTTPNRFAASKRPSGISRSVEIYHTRHRQVPASLEELARGAGARERCTRSRHRSALRLSRVDATSYEALWHVRSRDRRQPGSGLLGTRCGGECFTLEHQAMTAGLPFREVRYRDAG